MSDHATARAESFDTLAVLVDAAGTVRGRIAELLDDGTISQQEAWDALQEVKELIERQLGNVTAALAADKAAQDAHRLVVDTPFLDGGRQRALRLFVTSPPPPEADSAVSTGSSDPTKGPPTT